jgi:hypothetical protein
MHVATYHRAGAIFSVHRLLKEYPVAHVALRQAVLGRWSLPLLGPVLLDIIFLSAELLIS